MPTSLSAAVGSLAVGIEVGLLGFLGRVDALALGLVLGLGLAPGCKKTESTTPPAEDATTPSDAAIPDTAEDVEGDVPEDGGPGPEDTDTTDGTEPDGGDDADGGDESDKG